MAVQGPSTCAVELDRAGGRGVALTTPAGQRWYGNGGVFMHCRGQATNMRADSVAWYADQDRVDFIGKVHFVDSSVTLDADRASYALKREELNAQQHVVLVSRKTGSRMTSTNLLYKRQAKGVRDTSELFARERPRVEYRSEKDSAGAEPYIIIGANVWMRGDHASYAEGNVTITRSDLNAKADSAALDLGIGEGHLVGHAAVSGKDSVYTLQGRRIDYRLKDRKITWAISRGLAEATSSEWHMWSDTMQFDFANDRIQQGSAWGKSRRPNAVSSSQSVTADSLVIEAPNQKLKELRGYRLAKATSKDSTMIGEPNWVAGDTVIAQFDTTLKGKSYLAHLFANGRGQAYYCVAGEQKEKPPGYTYLRGRTIAAELDTSGMRHVNAGGGNVDGVYLEPMTVPKPDTTAASRHKADSLNNSIKKAC